MRGDDSVDAEGRGKRREKMVQGRKAERVKEEPHEKKEDEGEEGERTEEE